MQHCGLPWAYPAVRAADRLAYRCELLCGKKKKNNPPRLDPFPPHNHTLISSEGTQARENGIAAVTGNQSLPFFHFLEKLCTAHLVIRVVRTLIASSCNLGEFHISVKPYKAVIVQSKLQSYIISLSFQSGICHGI